MDNRRINEIKKRIKKASKGPWELVIGGNYVRIGGVGYTKYVEEHNHLGGKLHIANIRSGCAHDDAYNNEQSEADGVFIANARKDIEDALGDLVKYKEALIKYGEHTAECNIYTFPFQPCSCGLEEIVNTSYPYKQD